MFLIGQSYFSAMSVARIIRNVGPLNNPASMGGDIEALLSPENEPVHRHSVSIKPALEYAATEWAYITQPIGVNEYGPAAVVLFVDKIEQFTR
jgi:hypothetical protein